MLRAAGIPARPVSGVVLVGNAFYFHAWVEVWLGGHWIPVDPTFGLAPADPARVRLAHDWSDLTSVLVYLGTLKLDVTNTTHLSPND
jgi:transglutaminase-like putative cysteine protease